MAQINPGIVHRVFDRLAGIAARIAGMTAVVAVAGGLAAVPAEARDAANGRVLAEKWCAGCHLIGDSVPGSDVAPPFRAIASDPAKSRGRLEAWLATPHTAMPSMPLSRRDIDDLLTYIESLAP